LGNHVWWIGACLNTPAWIQSNLRLFRLFRCVLSPCVSVYMLVTLPSPRSACLPTWGLAFLPTWMFESRLRPLCCLTAIHPRVHAIEVTVWLWLTPPGCQRFELETARPPFTRDAAEPLGWAVECFSFLNSKFDAQQKNTIGAAFGAKRVYLPNGRGMTLGIWDTAGAERFESLSRVYYHSVRLPPHSASPGRSAHSPQRGGARRCS
jgi:hypothetical protein